MAGKNPEYEVKGYEERANKRDVVASVHRNRLEEVSRTKEILEREEDVPSTCEEYVSGHTGEGSERSPDTIGAYRAREPRAESHETVDTINAYRSTEPRPDSPYLTVSEEDS